MLRQDGLRFLSRLNQPVRAPAAGAVHKVVALPQGGFALVIALDGGTVGILTGLRQVEVAEGSRLEPGQPVGRVGRDLDGAPVVSFELWQRGTPIDPRPLLRSQPGTSTFR
jgi:septal ring factor EnvC (AmiA/AmiB activator)